MIKSFDEVAAAIKARQPELEPTITALETQLEAEREKLSKVANRATAHTIIDRIFDLRQELGQYSNNPVNKSETPKD